MVENRDGLKFSHMGIFVRDTAAGERFYADLLGFTVTDRGELTGPDGSRISLVFLSRDPDEHHQIVLVSGRPADAVFSTINQISLRADSLETLRRYYRRLSEAGAQGLACVSHGNAVSFYLEDPEGNRIEIFWDTPWYVPQPLREPIDIEVPDEVLMARIEEKVRAMPGFRLREEWRMETARLMGLA